MQDIEGAALAAAAAAGGKAAETAPAKKDSAWILDFDSWAQGSSGYAGVDSEMRMRLKTLYFFANRPTIGALIALGSDFGAAFSSGKPKVKSLLLLSRQMYACVPFSLCLPHCLPRSSDMLTVKAQEDALKRFLVCAECMPDAMTMTAADRHGAS